MSLLTHILKVAGVFDEMDVLARAQFMEGYLGLRPFQKIRGANGKPALLKAIASMMNEVGATSEEWVSRGDTGLYRANYMTINSMLKSQTGERTMEAGDVLQSMMGLSGWEDEEGEAIELGGKSPFWLAGKYAAGKDKDWLANGMTPSQAVGNTIVFSKRRTVDVLRQERDRMRKRRENEDQIYDETMSGEESGGGDWGTIIDAVFSNPEHALSKKFFAWLAKRIPMILSANTAEIMTQYLEILKSGQVSFKGTGAAGAGGGDSGIAKILNLTPQALFKAKAQFVDKMSEYIESHPGEQQGLRDIFEDASFLRDLFRGQVRAAAHRKAIAKALKAAQRECVNCASQGQVKVRNGSTHDNHCQFHKQWVAQGGFGNQAEKLARKVAHRHIASLQRR